MSKKKKHGDVDEYEQHESLQPSSSLLEMDSVMTDNNPSSLLRYYKEVDPDKIRRINPPGKFAMSWFKLWDKVLRFIS